MTVNNLRDNVSDDQDRQPHKYKIERVSRELDRIS